MLAKSLCRYRAFGVSVSFLVMAVACGEKVHRDELSSSPKGAENSFMTPVELAAAAKAIAEALGGVDSPLPATLVDTALVNEDGTLSRALRPFEVNLPLWSDGAVKDRFVFVPPGQVIAFDGPTGAFVFPIGTTFVKLFQTPETMAAVELRISTLRSDGEWKFGTYVFEDQQTKSARLNEYPRTIPTVDGSDHRLPSEKECTQCHSDTRNRVLGFRPEQLLRPVAERDQIATLIESGTLATASAEGLALKKPYPSISDDAISVAERARAYLEVNCASCHNPKTKENFIDMSYATPLADTGMLTHESTVVVGDPEASNLIKKMSPLDVERMPPTSLRLDEEADVILRRWIEELSAAP